MSFCLLIAAVKAAADDDDDDVDIDGTIEEDLGKSRDGSRTDDEVVQRWVRLASSSGAKPDPSAAPEGSFADHQKLGQPSEPGH